MTVEAPPDERRSWSDTVAVMAAAIPIGAKPEVAAEQAMMALSTAGLMVVATKPYLERCAEYWKLKGAAP